MSSLQGVNFDFRRLSNSENVEQISRGGDAFSSNMHCLEEIWSFLDYRSRTRLQLSDKCISDFVDHFWKSEAHFDIASVRPTIPTPVRRRLLAAIFHRAKPVRSTAWWAAINAVCSQIGDSLRSLRLSADLPLSADTLNTIIDYCPNICQVRSLSSSQLFGVKFISLQNLREIDFLRESPWSDVEIRELGKLPTTLEILTGLHVKGIGRSELILDACFPRYSMLRQFEFADLDYKGRYGHALMRQYTLRSLFCLIADACPNMERLTLVDCLSVSAEGIERFSKLKKLNIGGDFGQLKDEQVVEICARNRDLESLRIACRDANLTNMAYRALATLEKLQEFEIAGRRYRPERFTDTKLRTILASPMGVSLQRLSLLWPVCLSDASLDTIRDFCPNLRMLVTCCQSFSANALRNFLGSMASRFTNVAGTDEPLFQLYLAWKDDAQQAAQYAALVASTAFPAGVAIRRFDDDPVTFIGICPD